MSLTVAGWAGIINEHGLLSEVLASRGLAEMVLANRGDRDQCRIVPCVITTVEPEAPLPAEKPAKRGLFGRKRK